VSVTSELRNSCYVTLTVARRQGQVYAVAHVRAVKGATADPISPTRESTVWGLKYLGN